MDARAITLHLPVPLFEELKRRATEAHHSIEDELLEVVSAAVPEEEVFSPEISALSVLDDRDLWKAARARLPEEVSARLEELHWQRQRRTLTEAEDQERARLVRQYEHALLIRSHAARLLHERGHDISSLTAAG